MGKFNPGKLKRTQGKVPEQKLPDPTAGLSFSFKYANLAHGKFSLEDPPNGCLADLLTKLKSTSGMQVGAFLTHYSESMRNHKVTWSETTEPEGFSASELNEQLRGVTPYQFSCAAGGRVVGILIDEVFFAVWFDLHHRLQPMKHG